jgi:hypothetical protein
LAHFRDFSYFLFRRAPIEIPHSNKGYDFEALSFPVIGACIDVQRQMGLHCEEEDYQLVIFKDGN